MKLNQKSSGKTRGFSLMELLTVITIIAIILGTVFYGVSNFASAGLSTSTRQVADFMSLCRSRAIAGHTVVRFGVVVSESSEFPDTQYRAYSSWVWNKNRRAYEQNEGWKLLPVDVVFSSEDSKMIQGSSYAANDASSIRGNFILEDSDMETFEEEFSPYGKVTLRFLEFTAAGRARTPGGEKRNLITVLKPTNTGEEIDNWSQINVDRLTGRVRVYRPQ